MYRQEIFDLTGGWSPYSKRTKSYGCPNKRDPTDATSMVRGATFFQNAETVPYDFHNEFNGNENGFYLGAPHCANAK